MFVALGVECKPSVEFLLGEALFVILVGRLLRGTCVWRWLLLVLLLPICGSALPFSPMLSRAFGNAESPHQFFGLLLLLHLLIW